MQPVRILVIEDNALDIVLLRHALDKQGEDYELEILSNGEEALRFVHEHRTRVREPEPCVILMDLYLPFYDGMAVLRAFRQAPALEHIHVVVFTGLASRCQEIEIASMGALYRKKSSARRTLSNLRRKSLPSARVRLQQQHNCTRGSERGGCSAGFSVYSTFIAEERTFGLPSRAAHQR